MLDKMPELLRVTFEKTQALIQKKMPIFQENLEKKPVGSGSEILQENLPKTRGTGILGKLTKDYLMNR